MKQSFVQKPPHPETEWAACTAYDEQATPIKAVIQYPLQHASVCAGADGWYYMAGIPAKTGAAFNEHLQGNNGIMMWKSKDLEHWAELGMAAGSESMSIVSVRIHYLKNHYWLAYELETGGEGLLKSVSGSASGQYVDLGIISTANSSVSLFEEDDGTVYWVFGEGCIARMHEDLSGLAEPPRNLKVTPWSAAGRADGPTLNKNTKLGSNGMFILKHNETYFMFASDALDRTGIWSKDTFAAVSDQLFGPYSRRYLVIPHGGEAAFFKAHDNSKIYASFCGSGPDSVVYQRAAVIEMEFPELDFIRPTSKSILENGAMASLKPKADIPLRDTHICLAPDGNYFMTGTSNLPHFDFWNGNDELHVWTSSDLEKWHHVGKVWDLHINGTWENNLYTNPCLWAPEICYIKGTFWITYSLNKGSTGLLKSTSGEAYGPYIDMGRMTNTDIDSSLFADDDGQVYYVWQDGKIARMKEDMTGFAEDPRKLLTVDGETVGYEGAFIVKYGGKYILGAAEWNGDKRVDGTYDLMFATADHIYGPYSARKVGVPHGGHGTMFVNKQGKLMSTLFGNDRTAPFRARPGVIELTFENRGEDIFIWPAQIES